MYASAYDPTLFPLMDRHLKSVSISSYFLVGAFKFNSSTFNLIQYSLYYMTDRGLLNCEVTSYPKMINGFIAAGCNNVDSTTAILSADVRAIYLWSLYSYDKYTL